MVHFAKSTSWVPVWETLGSTNAAVSDLLEVHICVAARVVASGEANIRAI